MGKLKVIPKSEMTLPEILSLENKIERSLLNMALDKKLAAVESELVVRDILPTVDLAFATNAWTNQVAHPAPGAWLQDFSTVLAGLQRGRCMGFYKVFNRTLAPNIIASRFGLGVTSILGVLQLEELYVEQESVGFFAPIFYNDAETVRLEHYTDLAILINAEQIGFPGMVCEKYGDQIAQEAKSRIAAAKYV